MGQILRDLPGARKLTDCLWIADEDHRPCPAVRDAGWIVGTFDFEDVDAAAETGHGDGAANTATRADVIVRLNV